MGALEEAARPSGAPMASACQDHRVAELTLTALTERLAAEAAEWFRNDEEGQREFGGFYGAHPKWWDLVRADEFRHAWIALADHEAIGFIDLELTAENHLSYYIRREFRRQSLCPPLVQAAVEKAKGLCAPSLTAAIHPENIASLACCRRAGFVEGGVNRYGEVIFRAALR